MPGGTTPRRIELVTDALTSWFRERRDDDATGRERVVRRLGAHVVGDRVEFGMWTPELARTDVVAGSLALELLTPTQDLHWQDEGPTAFQVARIPVDVVDDFVWVAVDGVRVGHRNRFGAFYWLRFEGADGRVHHLRDPLASSLPYGVYAPAEVYDLTSLHEGRTDEAYFRSHGFVGAHPDPPRFGAPSNVLQLHVGTATPSGSLGELADLYRELADKVRRGDPLAPWERNFVEYDALQLLPVEPVIEYGGGGTFFRSDDLDGADDGADVSIDLTRPDVTNWGYDIVIAGSAAVNPALLRTGRPDELRDLAEVLHTFPGTPIRLIFDVVFGHSDNQGLALLPAEFFSGPNMYGQDMAFRHPWVRAIMLEMQRRKVDFGADGVRVDGAQDFTYWDPETDTVHHDDAYLAEMSAVVQHVAGASYRPFMIFEDGRPWPREDWETASTYRAVIDEQPHCYQWGPLTFAHNTPCLAGFWNAKWWRVEEILAHGGHWINGCANHDTLRRGYQISAERKINRRLGNTLPEILRSSYDHPAATLLTYGIFPGAPMEFIAATMRSPWAFVRNTDDLYGVKIVAEEHGFLTWRADPDRFARPDAFPRMKAWGFDELPRLASFLHRLHAIVDDGDYELARIATVLRGAGFEEIASDPTAFGVAELHELARDFMDDLHEYCLVTRFRDDLDDAQTSFNRSVRAFRRSRPWLADDFRDGDRLVQRVATDGSTTVVGLRTSPNGREQVSVLANLEGEPYQATLATDLRHVAGADGWRIAAASPGVAASAGDAPPYDHAFELADGQGVLLVRETPPDAARR